MASTSIEWAEHVWNPVAGCSRVSAGCDNCYAVAMTRRLEAMGKEKYTGLVGKGHFNGQISLDEAALAIPLKRKKPTTYFVNSMSDLFHESVPDEFLDQVFSTMILCEQHRFIALTKRPERMAEYTRRKLVCQPFFPPNVVLGVSCEDQATYSERVPPLLDTPAAIRCVSLEPLLGLIDILADILLRPAVVRDELDWVIVGGESGPRARPCDVAWIRSIVRQCKVAGVACFVKQLGCRIMIRNDSCSEWPKGGDDWIFAFPPVGYHEVEGDPMEIGLQHFKGGEPAEWPEDLRVREVPW